MTRNQTVVLVTVLIVLAAGLAVSNYLWSLRDALRRSDVLAGRRISRRFVA